MRASKSLQMTIQGHVEEYNPDRCYNFGTPVVSEGAVYISGGYLTRVSPQDRWGQVPFVEMGNGCDVAVRVSEASGASEADYCSFRVYAGVSAAFRILSVPGRRGAGC